MSARSYGGLAWIAAVFAAYLIALQRLWFDAPISDDYAIVLGDTMRMMDARSPREWLGIAIAQHNEHRVAVVRGVAWLMAEAGRIDFRALVLVGNLAVLGLCVLAWAEFRTVVAAPLFAAAALLTFQFSYYEAALMASAALPNIGVVFFSFASLYFAARGGAVAAAACVGFALLAVGSQGNGLFALPLAAAASAFAGKRSRAVVLAGFALALWVGYFVRYARPPHHPSLLAALADPLAAVRFFLAVLGGMVPGRWAPPVLGAALVAALAWLTRRGAWRAHPTAALWIAFLLLSAAAATAGRVGLGLEQAQSSRYAIYSSALVVIVFLAWSAATRPWSRGACAIAIGLAAMVNIAISSAAWQPARAFSRAGKLLVKVVPATPEVIAQRYLWMLSPDGGVSSTLLVAAERRGLYVPREAIVYPTAIRPIAAVPAAAPVAGHVDAVRVSARRVSVQGWSVIPATVPGRVLAVVSAGEAPRILRFEVTGRPDVVASLGDSQLLTAGFLLELEYASEEAARAAGAMLCLAAEAPGHALSVLQRADRRCGPGTPGRAD